MSKNVKRPSKNCELCSDTLYPLFIVYVPAVQQ